MKALPATRGSRCLAGLAIALLLLASSCGTLGGMLNDAQKPTARVKGFSFEKLSLDGVDLNFDVELGNPYSVPLPIARLDYALTSSATEFLNGSTDYQGTVPAKGTQMVPLRARIRFLEALTVLKTVRPGNVVPYTADLGISVDAPAIGRLRVPLQHTGDFPVPTVPRVSVSELKWNSLSLSDASATLKLDINNTNQFPLDLDQLAYSLALEGVEVATSSIQSQTSFKSGQHQPLELNFNMTPSKLGLAAVNVMKNASLAYRLNGTMQTMTPFGQLVFPIGDSGQAPTRK